MNPLGCVCGTSLTSMKPSLFIKPSVVGSAAFNGAPVFLPSNNPRIPASRPVPRNLPVFNLAPRPAIPPVSNAPLRASSVDAPPILFPTKLPRPEAKANGIVGSKKGATIGSAIGAIFLTTLLTDLNNFLRKNSGCPVTGFMLFSSLPTM